MNWQPNLNDSDFRRGDELANTDFNVHFGRVDSIVHRVASGWAWLPRRPGYGVVVHAIYRSKILRTVIAKPPQEPGRLLLGSAYRFQLDLGDVPPDRDLQFVVGETGREIPFAATVERVPSTSGLRIISVEDLLAIRGVNSWTRGLTYLDAIDAGLEIEEIVEMFFYDYLGRAPDPGGLQNYSRLVRQGEMTYDVLRETFIFSEEYRNRKFGNSILPGGFFSNPCLYAARPLVFATQGRPARRRVEAHNFLHLFGDELIRAAYSVMCRSPISDEILKPLASMFDRRGATKGDVLEEVAKIANVVSPNIELIGDEQMNAMPARRYHEIPLSLLMRPATPSAFIDESYSTICAMPLDRFDREVLVSRLKKGAISRIALLREFVDEAVNKYDRPTVIAFDLPDDQETASEPNAGSDEDFVEIDMNDPIVGYGWSKVDPSGSTQFRWMSEAAGIIVGDVPYDELFLTVEGAYGAAPVGFVCLINETPIEGRIERGKGDSWFYVAGPIPTKTFRRCSPWVIGFRTTDAEFEQSQPDPRRRALGVAKIRFSQNIEDALSATAIVDISPAGATGALSASLLAPLWGGELVRVIFEEAFARPPTESELKNYLSKLDAANWSKGALVDAILKTAPAPGRDLSRDAELNELPARRHHEVPLGYLLKPSKSSVFVSRAYFSIFGASAPSALRKSLTAQLDQNSQSREAMVQAFVAEANAKGIPAVVSFEPSHFEKMTSAPLPNSVVIPLDEYIVGYGWHKAEREDPFDFRWMPEAAGLLAPNVAGDVMSLIVEGFHFRDIIATTAFRCMINGAPLPGVLTVGPEPRWTFVSEQFDGSILRKSSPLSLAFTVTGVDVPQSDLDKRFLTVAISKVELRSV